MGPADLAEYRAPLASMEGRRMQLLLLTTFICTLIATSFILSFSGSTFKVNTWPSAFFSSGFGLLLIKSGDGATIMHTSVCRLECLQHSPSHPWSLSSRKAKVQDIIILFQTIGSYFQGLGHEIEFKYFDKSG